MVDAVGVASVNGGGVGRSMLSEPKSEPEDFPRLWEERLSAARASISCTGEDSLTGEEIGLSCDSDIYSGGTGTNYYVRVIQYQDIKTTEQVIQQKRKK